MSLAYPSGQRAYPVPPRRRPLSLPDAEWRRDRDRDVIKEVLRGELTKAQVAAKFGIARSTLNRIEERVFRNQPRNPTRRWRRPDMESRRKRAEAQDVAR